MNRRLLVPALLALCLMPVLACQTVLGALGVGATPKPPLRLTVEVSPEIGTALPPQFRVPPDIPVVEQAEDLIAKEGLVSYVTPLAFDQVLKFYQDQMPGNGWQEAEEESIIGKDVSGADVASLIYLKGSTVAHVSLDTGQGKTNVLITLAVVSGTGIPGPSDITLEPAPTNPFALPPEVPVVEPNENLISMEGNVSYLTPMSVDEVIQFYGERMLADGWQADGEALVVAGVTYLYYRQGNRTAEVAVGTRDGKTSVWITTGGG
ncbi:MAG: hypothetical protein HY260_12980 [Chloroflexi bacterium]|nr:hypothetical protein [Chloroflexota bacterium]